MNRKEAATVEDWIRVHRQLARAECEFTRMLERFGRGEISKEEVQAAKAPLQALRALAAAVSSTVVLQRAWAELRRE